MLVKGRWMTAGLLAVTMMMLGGCEEDEQGRVLYYEKGVYQGEADTGLDDETRKELRQRAQRQAN